MMRRLIACASVATLSFSFLACSDDGDPPKPDTIVDRDISVDTIMPDGPAGDGPQGDGPQIDMTADMMQADLPAGTSGQIALARLKADGATSVAITGAFVTYVKPLLGNDLGGFFVQADKTGPALFIAIDPSTLTPAPKVGDKIDLTVTEMATDASDIRYAKTVSGVATTTPGTDPIPGLIQDVGSAADLVTHVVNYEVELITGVFTLTKAFTSAGTGFVAAEAETASVKGDTNLKFRVPVALQKSLGLVLGCKVTLKATPMWRFKATAQPSATVAADISTYTCPAPTVVSAAGASATSVRVTFDRPVATVNADGSEFSFDNGLTASAAALDVSGLFVDVTTSAQASATTYKVTVAATVKDAQGVAVDQTKNSATFPGYSPPAAVVINEVNANIPSCDLLEFRVTAGGSMGSFALIERDKTVYTFPATFPVATDDIIVLHFNANNTSKCNPASTTDELTGIAQFPKASHSKNYDTAWDLWATDSGLTTTTNVFQLVDATGTIIDALLAHDGSTKTVASATVTAANVVGTANEWTPVPSGGFTAANFRADTVSGLKVAGSTDALQRANTSDTNALADWTTAASTWGVKNAGQ